MKTVLILSGFLLVLSLILTYVIKHIALNHKILDIPNERSSHLNPIPRGGGLAIVLTWYMGITALFIMKYIESNLYFALLSGLVLAIISLIDDLFDLKPFIRLIAQLMTAIIALAFLKGIHPIVIYQFEFNIRILLFPFTIVGIVWFINLYNFLDGIDGYASLEAATIALVMFIITGNAISLVLMACVLGFLFWNWPKAKIFMGDVGSTQLGFVLVIMGIYFHNKTELTIIQWLMLVSLFWFDATLTLYRRWRHKENLSVAHKKHAYQRAVQSGLSHQKTIILSLIINCVSIGFVFVSRSFMSLIIPLFFINLLFLYGITYLIDKKVPFI